jgi:PhzF family phenazine biosynthesis protein
MKIKMYQVDAFADQLFKGNPAAVCLPDEPIGDGIMQKIAAENNLSETAFVIKTEGIPVIRWFTPKVEVDLCGHATLATAHVFYHHLGFTGNELSFSSKSGILKIRKENDLLILDFPSEKPRRTDLPPMLAESLGIYPVESLIGKTDYLLVYDHREQIETMKPDFVKMGTVAARGVIVTAKGDSVDFVSRFFGPRVGINEDPVTGSAHTKLIPYWSERLGKKELSALQLSERGGSLMCRDKGDRVEIGGKAVTYFEGEVSLP